MNCTIYPLTNITPHPTLPHLDVAQLGPHQVVIGRHYDEGTLGIFLPDGAIIPDKLADEMWVKGKLAGKQKNRVKATTRDGVRTDGLFYGSRYYIETDNTRTYQDTPSWDPNWKEGDDVTTQIGVTFKEQ